MDGRSAVAALSRVGRYATLRAGVPLAAADSLGALGAPDSLAVADSLGQAGGPAGLDLLLILAGALLLGLLFHLRSS